MKTILVKRNATTCYPNVWQYFLSNFKSAEIYVLFDFDIDLEKIKSKYDFILTETESKIVLQDGHSFDELASIESQDKSVETFVDKTIKSIVDSKQSYYSVGDLLDLTSLSETDLENIRINDSQTLNVVTKTSEIDGDSQSIIQHATFNFCESKTDTVKLTAIGDVTLTYPINRSLKSTQTVAKPSTTLRYNPSQLTQPTIKTNDNHEVLIDVKTISSNDGVLDGCSLTELISQLNTIIYDNYVTTKLKQFYM